MSPSNAHPARVPPHGPPAGPSRDGTTADSRPYEESADPSADPSSGRRAQWSEDFDRAWVMAAELVAATLTWGGIGWLADRWLGTDPWLMVVGFVVGHSAGLYLIWLRLQAGERREAQRREDAERVRRVARRAVHPRSENERE